MPPGRPRTFDLEQALDKAMEVFWHKGYEGTSIPDLTAALGINRPSLYSAFGNKEALFRKVIDRYTEKQSGYVREALLEPNARVVAERILQGAVDLLSNPKNPRGCLMVQGALACGEDADCVRQELLARRLAGEAELRERFERAHKEKDLPPNTNPADLARYFITIIHGMSIQAASGANREALLRIADMAMRIWPE